MLNTHEWTFPGGSGIVTTTTGGTREAPDSCISGGSEDGRQELAAEVLKLAGLRCWRTDPPPVDEWVIVWYRNIEGQESWTPAVFRLPCFTPWGSSIDPGDPEDMREVAEHNERHEAGDRILPCWHFTFLVEENPSLKVARLDAWTRATDFPASIRELAHAEAWLPRSGRFGASSMPPCGPSARPSSWAYRGGA